MEIMKRIKRTIILALCLVLCGTVIPAWGENAGEKSRISSPEEAEFFVRTLIVNHCSLEPMDILVSDYDLEGKSSDVKNREAISASDFT